MYYIHDYEQYWQIIKKSRQNLSYKEEDNPLVNQCRAKLLEVEKDLQAFRERKPGHKSQEEINQGLDDLRLLEDRLQHQRNDANGKRLALSFGLWNIDRTTDQFETFRWAYRSCTLTYQAVEDILFNQFIDMLDPTDIYREQYLRSKIREILRPDQPPKNNDAAYYER